MSLLNIIHAKSIVRVSHNDNLFLHYAVSFFRIMNEVNIGVTDCDLPNASDGSSGNESVQHVDEITSSALKYDSGISDICTPDKSSLSSVESANGDNVITSNDGGCEMNKLDCGHVNGSQKNSTDV